MWTTDAPYRETPDQLRSWAEKGVLAVEMQAASLFAFARARGAHVGMVALVSNGVDGQVGDAQFDTGGHEFRMQRPCRGGPGRTCFLAVRAGVTAMACCCTFEASVDELFTNKKARQELERYRRKGAGPTTRLLIEGLSQAGLVDGSLLDVGAGVGALTFELLNRVIRRAVIVEASAGYAAAASSEAARRGHTTRIELKRGDFLEVADTIPVASVVTLDRVICCYPLYERLLSEALRHAERGFAFSYPERSLVRENRYETGERPSAASNRISNVCPSGVTDA